MQLTLNGQDRELEEGTTIAQLLEQLELDPRMLALFVDADTRLRKRRIREPADGYADHSGTSLNAIPGGRTTRGAEIRRDPVALITVTRVRRWRACEDDVGFAIGRLNTEGAPRPPLAVETMTDRYSDRLAQAPGIELSAGASGDSLHAATLFGCPL